MQIKILGTGCAKCMLLERNVKAVIETHQLQDIFLEKVTDFEEILNYNILTTPGLVVDGETKSSGGIPSNQQILSWLKND